MDFALWITPALSVLVLLLTLWFGLRRNRGAERSGDDLKAAFQSGSERLERELRDELSRSAQGTRLELGTALKLAGLIAVVMLTAQAAQNMMGASGVLAMAAVAGLLDVDAVTIAMARLGSHQITLETAGRAITRLPLQ